MGCACIIEHPPDSENHSFTQAESHIGFGKLRSIYIDRVLHRHSSNFVISKKQLSLICKELAIDEDSLQSFFKMFYKNRGYELLRLSCLGILLGQGSLNEKAMLLFENYDYDTSKTLSKDEVKIMITDILTISCIIIPNYSLELRFSPELYKYSTNLKMVVSGLINHFTDKIVEDKSELNPDEFVECIKNNDLKILVSSIDIRNYAYEVYLRISKSAELIKESMKDRTIFNSDACKRFSNTSKTIHRRTSSALP